MFKSFELIFKSTELKFKSTEHKFKTIELNFYRQKKTIVKVKIKNYCQLQMQFQILMSGMELQYYICISI